MKTREEKSENLIQRLNRSMKAIEVVAGVIVKVRKIHFGKTELIYNLNFKEIITDEFGEYIVKTEVKEEDYLLYLGIEKVGPFNWTGRAKRPKQSLLTAWNQEIFAFKFLQNDNYVYLLISKPHDYYQVFIRNVERVGGVTSFGK